MNPAVSVIFFTVLSGAGFGFILFLGAGCPIQPGVFFPALSCGLAIGMTVAGLISSTFHLGHPERAWRALTQWRSSWLSREGVMSLTTLTLFSVYSFIWLFFGERVAALGFLCSINAFFAVIATAMIYTQLKTVPNWHTALTPASYVLFSIASGLLIASSIAGIDRVHGVTVSGACIVALLCAWGMKILWWRRAAIIGLANSTRETATGLGGIGKVRLLERPHTGPNYLTKEMVYRIGRKHANTVRGLALLFGALLPVAICTIVLRTSASMKWQLIAFISLLVGLFAERWLFFAEAEHSVSLYY